MTIQMIEGDCNSVLPSLSQFFDLAIIDPPYFVLNKTNLLNIKNHNDIIRFDKFDCFESYTKYLQFIQLMIKNTSDRMKNDSTICCFCAIQYITDITRILNKNGFNYTNYLIWIKQNPLTKIRMTSFRSSYEAIITASKGKPIFNFLNQSDMKNWIATPICQYPERILQHNDQTGFNHALHPTQKPVKLLKWLIQIFSNKQCWILDSTAGVGSTLVAANDLNRNAIGIECNPIYVQAFEKRIKNTIVNGKKLGDY